MGEIKLVPEDNIYGLSCVQCWSKHMESYMGLWFWKKYKANTLKYTGEGHILDSLPPSQSNRIFPYGLTPYHVLMVTYHPIVDVLEIWFLLIPPLLSELLLICHILIPP